MITKEEFHKILKEDKFHSDFDEQVKYRYPALVYWMANYAPQYQINGATINLRLINIIEPSDDNNKCLLNNAFNQIKVRFDKGEFQ
ncbi:MAG: hypothetical protein HGA35_05400 [Erysipelotrichaceae bacterium]|nr:hypothetical protein [Erysipelotrichaceae bacterium]